MFESVMLSTLLKQVFILRNNLILETLTLVFLKIFVGVVLKQ